MIRKYTLLLVLGLVILGNQALLAQRKAKTPEDLLKAVYKLAKAKKHEKLKKYFLYNGILKDAPKESLKGKRLGDIILEGVKNNNGKGEFGYTNDGLKDIIDNHLDRIAPISAEISKELFGNDSEPGPFAQFDDLKKIHDNNPNDIKIFDYKGIHILMAKFPKSYKLVFWEGVGKAHRHSSTEPSKGGK